MKQALHSKGGFKDGPQELPNFRRVIDRATKNGAAKLRIEAWVKDSIIDDLIGSTVTNEQGAFDMQFDRLYFKKPFWWAHPR